MTQNMLKNLLNTVQKGRDSFSRLSAKEKNNLEKRWDIEHAYYSSSLEGSKLDKKEFEKLAEKVS